LHSVGHNRSDALYHRPDQIFLEAGGVGYDVQIPLLSGLPTSDLISAISSSDLVRLVRIPGIGKKTARNALFSN
jgi:Holliday junction DNA helicase RuvA